MPTTCTVRPAVSNVTFRALKFSAGLTFKAQHLPQDIHADQPVTSSFMTGLIYVSFSKFIALQLWENTAARMGLAGLDLTQCWKPETLCQWSCQNNRSRIYLRNHLANVLCSELGIRWGQLPRVKNYSEGAPYPKMLLHISTAKHSPQIAILNFTRNHLLLIPSPQHKHFIY